MRGNPDPQQVNATPDLRELEHDDSLSTVWPWLNDPIGKPLRSRIPAPRGYHRLPASEGSFASWLRNLPVLPGKPEVKLYNGQRKENQSAHHAVLNIDVGSKDLQQCTDAVIRLRAEYLFSTPCRDEIRFNFTSGDTARWKDWRSGVRPRIRGNTVGWSKTVEPDDSYSCFRQYLDEVFMYAGSASLSRELLPVQDPSRPEVGDVYIMGGFPGHAVLVVDVAEDKSGRRVFLLAQSYMPAQDIHVLRSFDEDINPWYRARSEGTLVTPEWEFRHRDLMRFRRTTCEPIDGQAPN